MHRLSCDGGAFLSASIIDFVEVRAARDSAVRLGRAMAERMVGSIVESVHRWAERAERISGPLLSSDAEAARAINKWAARRLRAEVRRTLIDIPMEARADLTATAEEAFIGAMIALSDRRAASEVAR